MQTLIMYALQQCVCWSGYRRYVHRRLGHFFLKPRLCSSASERVDRVKVRSCGHRDERSLGPPQPERAFGLSKDWSSRSLLSFGYSLFPSGAPGYAE